VTHWPPVQVCPDGHPLQHIVLAVAALTHWPPHITLPVGTHCPPEQVWVHEGQTLPHEPQLLLSERVSAQHGAPAPAGAQSE
jgi:hypothetical protein